jgi:hypothetical protein
MIMKLCKKLFAIPARTVLAVMFVMVALTVTACTGILEKEPVSGRRLSQQSYYTSDLHHEQYLKEDMRLMNISVKALQTLATDDTIDAEERHARVMRELDTIQSTARIIKDGREIFSYSSISPYMGSFLYDLAVAREHAQRTPPDYQPATWLVKSCLYCHDNI